MRDVLFIPFNDDEMIVIASDNSGAIGMKAEDVVKAPYETVAYFSFRVAAMECIAAGGEPFVVTLQNFCGEDVWLNLQTGIEKGLIELGLEDVNITGSTESNFPLRQSAIGLTILGKKKKNAKNDQLLYTEQLNIAVIGLPLVGKEVIDCETEVAPLSLFKKISSIEEVTTLPVGSKGILYELNTLFPNRFFQQKDLEIAADPLRSSGPATCFLVVYPSYKEAIIKNAAGRHFREIKERNAFN